MNKKLLSVAVAAGIASAGGVQAATVDFTAATPTPATIANEVTIPATGLTILGDNATGAVAALSAKFDAGFAIDAVSTSYVRIDISSGTWQSAQATADLTINTTGIDPAITLVSGGATTDSFVIYSVLANSAANAVVPTDDFIFTPTGGITALDRTTIDMTYRLFETSVAAVNQGDALATDSGTFVQFGAGNSVLSDAVGTDNKQINVQVATATGAVFVGGNPSTIGLVNVTDAAGVSTANDNVAFTSNAQDAAAVLTVTGDFTFTQDLTALAPDGTYTLGTTAAASAYLSTSADCSTRNVAATAITDTSATFSVLNANPDILSVCVQANGVGLIPEQTFGATLAVTGDTGFENESTILNLATVTKNGTSATQNLVLTPNGAFKNFLRVSNTSNVAGSVSFSLTNDAGTTVAGVNLGDVAGQTTSTLAAQGSTALIDVNDLYAAAQAASATFDVNGGKLRVTATGNFGGIDMQNITLTSDNSEFDTF
jgi:hypothetical protein